MFAILLLGQTNQLTKQNTEGSGAWEGSAGPQRADAFSSRERMQLPSPLCFCGPGLSTGAGLTRLLPEGGAMGCCATLGQVAAQRKTGLRLGNLGVWAKKMKFFFFFPRKIMPPVPKEKERWQPYF